MNGASFEQSLKIRQVSTDTFESTAPSQWTWPNGRVVPGGVLMAFGAAAAYETLSSEWSIDSLQSRFLLGPDPTSPFQLKVQRLSDGGRFATRAVEVQQSGKLVCHVTCSFVRTSSLHGPSMKHTVRRATDYQVDKITLDDLAPTEEEKGTRWMQFQRLGIQPAPGIKSSKPTPDQLTYASVGTIPNIKSNSRRLHALGLLVLSDYHVLDGPPYLHGLSLGQPAIGDTTQAATRNDFDRFTSLSHNIHFNVHDGFRADSLCYVEVSSSWTNGRRANIQSSIFTPGGSLIATCVQDAYYVLASGQDKSNL